MSGRTPLSANFFLDEFTRSETAARQGRAILVPLDSPVFLNLQYLCVTLLQPIREALGPVQITSGFRPEWLNLQVGGSRTSDHCKGLAADFVVAGMTPLEACRAICRMNLGYKQLIHEFGRWAHISTPGPGLASVRQDLTAMKADGRTLYVNGLQPVGPGTEV